MCSCIIYLTTGSCNHTATDWYDGDEYQLPELDYVAEPWEYQTPVYTGEIPETEFCRKHDRVYFIKNGCRRCLG